ncbi:hypothetical protein [Lacihabitans soyangensis]|uniref:Uncharacterized protein n=1 Tax=Lacihabitans soyangensis TaxID=869394 RepID=A0AAE3H3S4_9BACT|nr:hypothetical protein [Lacihabitans soyangensis]MCP9764208.1 hypothetical protein [Lacihabitans soyangensis]MCP9765381.1 hypothetical protein [Lacihabitans soyangensis]
MYDQKFNFDIGQKDSLYFYTDLNEPKIRVKPSLLILNKRGNSWELQLEGGLFDQRKSKKYQNFPTSDIYSHSSKFVRIIGINHVNFIQNPARKVRFSISLNYMLGYEKTSNTVYFGDSYNNSSTRVLLEYGVSTRIGYNLSEKLFFEINPPFLKNKRLELGKKISNHPSTPISLRRQPIFDFEHNGPVLNYTNFRLSDTYFRDIVSLGFKF